MRKGEVSGQKHHSCLSAIKRSNGAFCTCASPKLPVRAHGLISSIIFSYVSVMGTTDTSFMAGTASFCSASFCSFLWQSDEGTALFQAEHPHQLEAMILGLVPAARLPFPSLCLLFASKPNCTLTWAVFGEPRSAPSAQ